MYKTELLEASKHRVTQLALLTDVSKQVADSLDEVEILQRTVESIVNRFGYAQAAVSMLEEGGKLKLTVVSGTEVIGYELGYEQKIGEGIIGHTAKTSSTYVTGDVEHDPYYYTIGKRSGSALGIPIMDEDQLLGVLYVESTALNAFNQEEIQTLQTLVSHVVTAVQKARLYERVNTQLRTITTLQSVSSAITSNLELQKIFETVLELLKNTFKYSYVSLYLLEDQVLRLGAQLGYTGDHIYHEIPITQGIVGRAVQTKQIQFIRDVSREPEFLRAAHEIESEICVPLVKDNNVLGILNVEAAPGRILSEADVEGLTALAGPIAVAIDNARLHAEVISLALTDSLTGLANRRAFDRDLGIEVARSERYGHPLSLIIIDMDSFKSYNDQWGHPAGDERLRAVAQILMAHVRSPDLAARIGGEEFAVILPYTSKTGAGIAAERLRSAAEALAPAPARNGTPIPGYTLSLGVAAFPEDGETAEALFRSADEAELAAKKLGKNRTSLKGRSWVPVSKP